MTELVSVLGAPLAKLHYHATRLLGFGLIEVVRSARRGGRPVRYYRATAKRFEVPYEFLPELPPERWSGAFRASLRREYERADIALLYEPDENGDIRVSPMRRDPAGSLCCFELWRPMRLNGEQQMDLGRDLAAVLERYCQLEPGVGAKELLTHVAFAPRG